ncbi:hypothetical protein PENTCL1PPCAC_22159 [Pristionchus entomophagus]|uniref:L-type lectin-like domain-containing protein n=1 Tax=Pristionchus entomophagus TaxID=358040 RepID=A0AAV5U1F3_9BILA|nr:hypothetical protein PENTCL1PPCAC_22159 [Pristionchus entomophagus]
MLPLFLLLSFHGATSTEQKNRRWSSEYALPVARLTLTKPYGQFWTHWDVRGKVASTNNEIRLTPAVKGVSGAIWSKTSLAMGGFGVEVDFRFASKDGLHADGAAVWFVDKPSHGPAYGISSNFTGIGVVLDTFKNLDYSSGSFIGIVGSDGTTTHTMDHNGKEVMLGKCNVPNMVKVDKNRKMFGATISVYVEYLGNIIRVFYKYPDTDEWKFCDDSKVHIPLAYSMGLSASTGELSSRHELLALRVFEIPVDASIAVKRSTDKLSFQKVISTTTNQEDELTTVIWVFLFAIIVIIIILAAILCLDYYVNGEDRILTC